MTDAPPEASHATAPDSAQPTAALPPARPARSGRPSWLPFALGALVVIGIAVVVILTVFSGGGDDKSAAYRDKVSEVLAPVITANKQLSTSLTALHGTGTRSAQRKVARAESATIAARGGLTALTVPSGATQTALNARQTLTREAAYLQAVKVVLASPSSDAAQTQTLAANLTGALDTIAPAGKDWSQSVQGADTLTAWAPKAASTIRAHQRAAARKRAAARRARSGSSTTSSRTSPAPSALSGGSECGGGLHAGPNTTCAFAQNVRSAWAAAPGSTNTLRVYSPVTGQTYTMNCAPAGGGITCSGANNASVSWD